MYEARSPSTKSEASATSVGSAKRPAGTDERTWARAVSSAHKAAPAPLVSVGTGCDAVQPDAERGEFDGQSAGHGQHARLRGGGVHRAGVAVPGIAGDDGEDRTAGALVAHLPGDGPGAVEGTVEDDVDDGLPAVWAEVDTGGDEVSGRVVDEAVNGAVVADCGVYERVDGPRVADVGGDGDAVGALLAEECDGLVQLFRSAAGDDYAGAGGAQREGDGAADATTTTGDDERAIGEHSDVPSEGLEPAWAGLEVGGG